MAKPDIDRAGGQMLRWSSTNDLVAGDDEVAGDDSGGKLRTWDPLTMLRR